MIWAPIVGLAFFVGALVWCVEDAVRRQKEESRVRRAGWPCDRLRRLVPCDAGVLPAPGGASPWAYALPPFQGW